MIPLHAIEETTHGCRPACGACCIAPSITTPIPGMPQGKPAGMRCIHLTADYLCAIFGQAGRPPVCADFSFELMVCGTNRNEALSQLQWLEQATS